MNKWYRSAPAKGVLVVLAHILAVTAVISLVWVVSFPGISNLSPKEWSNKRFEDTSTFNQEMHSVSQEILMNISRSENFETDGKYDENRIVDIKNYAEKNTVSGENENGLAYRLGDLYNWSMKYQGNIGNIYGPTDIIVARKPDGTYRYYRLSEIKNMSSGKKITFRNDDYGEDAPQKQYISDLENNAWGEEDNNNTTVLDADGNVMFEDIWNFGVQTLKEAYPPEGAKDLLDFVNNNKAWNGKLSEIYEDMQSVLTSLSEDVDAYKENHNVWSEGNTNLTYIYANGKTGTVYTNNSDYTNYAKLEQSVQELTRNKKFIIVKPKLSDFHSNMKANAEEWRNAIAGVGPDSETFVFAASVDTTYPIQDHFYNMSQKYTKAAPLIGKIIGLLAASVFLFVTAVFMLTLAAGRRRESEEVYQNLFDILKTEFAIAFLIGGGGLVAAAFEFASVQYSNSGDSDAYAFYTASLSPEHLIAGGFIAVCGCAAFLIGYLSLVRRWKAGTAWNNSILKWLIQRFKDLLEWCSEIYQNRSVTTKTIVLFAAVVLVHWMALLSYGTGVFIFLMFVVEAVVFFYLIKSAVGRQRILTGIKKIAEGEVDYQICVDKLKGDQLMIAQRINSIGEGLEKALEESMKNERLKTDLITNVSHDIKTPLTSIINYVDLLKRENIQDPKIQGYLDILEAKAQRLKTLTEDVVEASKVSSGNITLDLMNINLVEMIQQTSGEFEEKFEKRNLKEILTLPEETVLIRVDGRRMWRILENIYNNAAKYAMEGTRIYADLKVKADVVSFSLKNISDQPLNITSDELTERFIRGDVSRSSEGSGLGLSIAKTLTELQGGKFNLYLDGDLFKVTILFPLVKGPEFNRENYEQGEE